MNYRFNCDTLGSFRAFSDANYLDVAGIEGEWSDMMNVKEIESAIVKLPEDAVWELAEWFKEYQAELWDKQIEEDILAGRLDALADEALRDLDEGRVTDL